MPLLLTSKKFKDKNCFLALKLCHMILSHPLTININLLSKHESNVWQNPNDPDDENEHFKQPLIAIEKRRVLFII